MPTLALEFQARFPFGREGGGRSYTRVKSASLEMYGYRSDRSQELADCGMQLHKEICPWYIQVSATHFDDVDMYG